MGVLRQPVPVPSPYAYQKASWLVLALTAAPRGAVRRLSGRGTSVGRDRSPLPCGRVEQGTGLGKVGRYVTGQVHSVMKDADYLDDIPLPCPIHDEMTAPTTAPRNMQGSKVRENFIACGAAENVWPVTGKRDERIAQRLLVNIGLLRPESVLRIFQDASKISLGLGTKADCPRLRQGASVEPERTRLPRSSR